MNFTSKINVGRVVSGLLTIAVLGLLGWVQHVSPPPAPIAADQNVGAVQRSFTTSGFGVEPAPALALPMAGGASYQPVSSWIKNKHWWKRNAPIIGGAGGGALVGGLIGGGTGAVVGGAIGGGGGYLYKRSRQHHYAHHYDNHHYAHR